MNMSRLLKGSAENLSDKRVMEFIDIGSKDDFAGLEEWMTIDQDKHTEENCFVQINWQGLTLAEKLNNEQISSIVRALIAVDMKGLERTGSTTGVHRYLQVLHSRGEWIRASKLREFAFDNAKNGYISLRSGAFGKEAKSYAEYCRLRSEFNVSQEKSHKELLARKREASLARLELQRFRQNERSTKRNAILVQMASFSPIEKLSAIVLDNEHLPYFYPVNLVAFSDKNWLSFPTETTTKLLEKLRHPPRGPWRSLAKRLHKLMNPA